jgi:ABC-type lipoprotein release transport system permease subunit
MIIRIAWRNLWRNSRRTIITLISIAFGFLLAITFTSLSDGSYGKLIDTAAKMGSGHITIEPIGYREKPGNDLTVTDTYTIAKKIKTMPGITNATVRIVGQAMMATAADSAGVGFVGLDPNTEQGIFFLLDHIKKGSSFASSNEKTVLIGSSMAKMLEVDVRKKMVITTTDKNGEVVSGLVRVAGIFETGVDEVDKYVVIVPIDYMRGLLGYKDHEATQVAIYLKNRRAAERMSKNLSPLAHPHGGVALPWSETMPDVAGLILMDKTGNYIFQIIIFLLIGAGILNTVLMSVMERLREFGVMIAVGMTPRRIWSMVISEAVLLAIVGLIVGAFVSIPVYWYLSTHGIDIRIWLSEKQVYGGVIMEPIMRATFYLDHFLFIFGGVFVLIIFAGLYPAFFAARTRPAKTLKTL